MMNTSDNTLAKDEIITETGRVFRPAHKELLESLPSDMVQELARRRMNDIERIRRNETAMSNEDEKAAVGFVG